MHIAHTVHTRNKDINGSTGIYVVDYKWNYCKDKHIYLEYTCKYSYIILNCSIKKKESLKHIIL